MIVFVPIDEFQAFIHQFICGLPRSERLLDRGMPTCTPFAMLRRGLGVGKVRRGLRAVAGRPKGTRRPGTDPGDVDTRPGERV
jgi:hypothetical protein